MTPSSKPPFEQIPLNQQPGLPQPAAMSIIARIDGDTVTVVSGWLRLQAALGLGRDVALITREGQTMTARNDADGVPWAHSAEGTSYRIV